LEAVEKKVTSPDPDYVIKKQRIETLKKKAVAGDLSSHDAQQPDMSQPVKPATLVYFDSTDLHWLPDEGHAYSAVGEQVKVETPGNKNPWSALFGSLCFPTGEGLYTIHQRKRHQEVEAHLQMLIDMNPDTFHLVIMDNASAHTTPSLDAFWEKNKANIEPVFLPTYSPHLNLIERLWGFMRGQMTRSQFYESFKVQCEAIAGWFENLSFSRFCSLLGIDESSLQLS
jgi:hypothetical protein